MNCICRDNQNISKFCKGVCGGEGCGNGTHIGIWVCTFKWSLHMFGPCASLCWHCHNFNQVVSYISHLCQVSCTFLPWASWVSKYCQKLDMDVGQTTHITLFWHKFSLFFFSGWWLMGELVGLQGCWWDCTQGSIIHSIISQIRGSWTTLPTHRRCPSWNSNQFEGEWLVALIMEVVYLSALPTADLVQNFLFCNKELDQIV